MSPFFRLKKLLIWSYCHIRIQDTDKTIPVVLLHCLSQATRKKVFRISNQPAKLHRLESWILPFSEKCNIAFITLSGLSTLNWLRLTAIFFHDVAHLS